MHSSGDKNNRTVRIPSCSLSRPAWSCLALGKPGPKAATPRDDALVTCLSPAGQVKWSLHVNQETSEAEQGEADSLTVPKPKVTRMVNDSMTKPSFCRAKIETKSPRSLPVSDVHSHFVSKFYLTPKGHNLVAGRTELMILFFVSISYTKYG